MNNTYQEFHQLLIHTWVNECLQLDRFKRHRQKKREEDVNKALQDMDFTEDNAEKASEDPHFSYCLRLENLKQAPLKDESRALGQRLIIQAIASYPEIVPLIPRDLFWYFGGDCMHYLGDEEIRAFQALDEAFYEAKENISYSQLRNQCLGLH